MMPVGATVGPTGVFLWGLAGPHLDGPAGWAQAAGETPPRAPVLDAGDDAGRIILNDATPAPHQTSDPTPPP